MDQITSLEAYERAKERHTSIGGSPLKRALLSVCFVALMIGVLAVGFRLGRSEVPLSAWLPSSIAAWLGAKTTVPTPSGAVIYYRDPDGKFSYSAQPKKTADGREFVPVLASEDVSFDDPPQSQTTSPATGAKRLLYYRNPMGLPDTSPVPKKDSMGMDYLPVYEGEEQDGTTIKVSPGRLQRTGVRSEAVERRILTRALQLPGTIQLDERRVAVVATRSDAFIDRVENVTTGDMVRKGQPLLQLYSPEIASASAQFMTNPGYEGSRRRLENLNVPADVIAEIERTRKVPLSIIWSAPSDGLVLERNAVPGMKAPAGQVLFRIADHSVVWAMADVPERELNLVAEGQSALVRVRGYPDRSFAGKVSRIYPQINTDTRTARLRVEIANPDGVLRPDMYADIELKTGGGAPVVAVPESAVIDSGTRQVVIIDKGDGRFEPRPVKIGMRGNGFAEIREGISETDRVVTTANFLIDAESNLKAALSGLSSGDQPK
jgi:Cu(I)/Ag(I) efflux system membrane fusion protein